MDDKPSAGGTPACPSWRSSIM